MNDLFGRLAARATGQARTLEPLVRTRFDQGPDIAVDQPVSVPVPPRPPMGCDRSVGPIPRPSPSSDAERPPDPDAAPAPTRASREPALGEPHEVVAGLRELAVVKPDVIKLANTSDDLFLPTDWLQSANKLAEQHELLVTIEENAIMGGAGSGVNEVLAQHNVVMPVLNLGIADYYVEHGKPSEMLEECGLDKAGILKSIQTRLDKLGLSSAPQTAS